MSPFVCFTTIPIKLIRVKTKEKYIFFILLETKKLRNFAFLRPPQALQIEITVSSRIYSALGVLFLNNCKETKRKTIITRLCFSYAEACDIMNIFSKKRIRYYQRINISTKKKLKERPDLFPQWYLSDKFLMEHSGFRMRHIWTANSWCPPLKYWGLFSKRFSWGREQTFWSKFMELVLHGRVNDQIMSMAGSFINVFSSTLNIANLKIFPNHGIFT